MKNNKNMLIWVDLEMTGLNPESDRILEIAVVVTNRNLDIVNKGVSIAVNQPNYIIDRMDSWNMMQHKKTGLIDRVRKSIYSEQETEEKIMQFIKQYTNSGVSPICGNTIHQDRFFLKKYMPRLESFFHYRNLDVSTIKILTNIWSKNTIKIVKREKHMALYDIYDSIYELRYYKQHTFKL